MSLARLLIFLSGIWSILLFPASVYAIVDPLARPNNKFGIHILFPEELEEAAKLVNSNGGEWGYVTIPLQITDLDKGKWQHFLSECKRLRIIPIIRLATRHMPTNSAIWEKPTPEDILTFATFLNSLVWPTKNRYIIIFNEVNRADEWGGAVDPADYANILSFAVTVFKSKHPDFFIISAGLDNAAPNKGSEYMNQYDFMAAMNQAVPGIFHQVDALSSHSYPNPGFSQPPSQHSTNTIASFYYERAFVSQMTNKNLPIFITETGWTSDFVTDEKQADYYKEAFESIWSDPGIVAITPFLLNAQQGVFTQFSFFHRDGRPTKHYEFFKNLPKIKGSPVTPPPPKRILGTDAQSQTKTLALSATKNAYDKSNYEENQNKFLSFFQSAIAWIKHLL